MANQDNRFIQIESSYSYVGGDKSIEGLQEYLSRSDTQRHSLSANINLVVETKEINFVGEEFSYNETDHN